VSRLFLFHISVVAAAGAVAFGGCGGDGEDAEDSGGDQTGIFTTTPEGTVTSKVLDRWFAAYDAVCSPDTGSDACRAFMEKNCGEVDVAPRAFCNTAEADIFSGVDEAAQPQEEAAEAPEKEDVPKPEKEYAVGDIVRGEVVNGAAVDGQIVEVTVDIGAEEVAADVPPGIYHPNEKIYALSFILGDRVKIQRTEGGWVFVEQYG
jgi:hypothetical protein